MESLEEEIPLSPTGELRALVDDRINEDDVFETDADGPEQQKKSSSQPSPLISAVRRRSSSIYRFMRNTDPEELSITETDSCGRNSFHYCVNKPDTLKLLVETFKSFPASTEALSHEDKYGKTPIHQAAYIGSKESLEILYECDNSLIKLPSRISKCSVLHYAVQSMSLVAVQFILSVDPDQLDNSDSMGRTPVHYAASLKQRNIIAFLISKGGDITIEGANGQLPIHIAASKGLLNIVDVLVQSEPTLINSVDNIGQTPLLLAAQNDFHNVVAYFLDKGADYTIKDNGGYTAFDWAVYNKGSDVIEVFFGRDCWKDIVLGSKNGPGNCLARLIEDQSETAVKLMDKCISVDDSDNYQVKYDFFCLDSKANENIESATTSFQAISSMVDNVSEACLTHPLCVKYINEKWRRRGFKFHSAAVLLTLVFHICLMIYTIKVRGTVTTRRARILAKNQNITLPKRFASKPDEDGVMAMRIIMLLIVVGTMLKELTQIFLQRLRYWLRLRHYYQWALCISLLCYILPVNQEITARQLGSGSISVLLSWVTLIQFLQIIPILGVYILAVQKVFWTLMKVLVVIFLFLMSFSTTFYILLAEHDSFNNLGISVVSSFNAMINGIDYETLFVEEGTYRRLYEIKLIVLVLFIVVMSIVVNNTLIGLAVGDTEEVMKSARFEKFRHKVLFIIHLERSLNRLPGYHVGEEHSVTEYPKRRKSKLRMFMDFIYFGREMDFANWGNTKVKGEEDQEIHLEDHFEKLLAPKLEEIRSTMQGELKAICKRMEKYEDGQAEKDEDKIP